VVDTSGHTAGHVSFEISAGLNAMVIHPTISFAHPDWLPAADHHEAHAAATMRRGLLDKFATDRQHIIGFHLAFPGGWQGRAPWHGLPVRAHHLVRCDALTRYRVLGPSAGGIAIAAHAGIRATKRRHARSRGAPQMPKRSRSFRS
jgi:hypothetical protein